MKDHRAYRPSWNKVQLQKGIHERKCLYLINDLKYLSQENIYLFTIITFTSLYNRDSYILILEYMFNGLSSSDDAGKAFDAILRSWI